MTSEEIADDYILNYSNVEIEKVDEHSLKIFKDCVLRAVSAAKEEEPRINCGVHLADWLMICDDDDTMTSFYGRDYFDL